MESRLSHVLRTSAVRILTTRSQTEGGREARQERVMESPGGSLNMSDFVLSDRHRIAVTRGSTCATLIPIEIRSFRKDIACRSPALLGMIRPRTVQTPESHTRVLSVNTARSMRGAFLLSRKTRFMS